MAKKLSGKALQDRARDLNIPGRSKMSADELRAEILHAEAIDANNETFSERNPETMAIVEMKKTIDPLDVPHVVPNRADKRRYKRSRNLRNDGTRKRGASEHGGREDAFNASVIAGQRGKFYGNRKIAHSVPPESADENWSPRSVPVNVVHEGH